MHAKTEMGMALQVFPVHKVWNGEKKKWGKFPAVPKGVSWKDYRASERELEMAKNIGVVVPMGKALIDLDTHKGVTREAVEAVLGCKLDWEPALIQRTVSKGEHYVFDLPLGAVIRQGDSLLGVAGFDTRAAGQGWFCTGDGYEDMTLTGLPEAVIHESFPELPMQAVEAINGTRKALVTGEDDVFDLDRAIAMQPLDGLTLQDLRDYLAKLPAEDVEGYTTWLKPGMATHHQTRGSDDGLKIWIEWSKKSTQFNRAECVEKWRSFDKRDNIEKPTRFDYVIHRAGGRAVVAQTVFERLAEQAASVDSLESYEAFKREVRKHDRAHLPKDMRAMLAQEVFNAFGKGKGLSRSDIKNELAPPKPRDPNMMNDEERDVPEWAQSWVYVEATCEFANTNLAYAIKREAFNAKFDRMPDVAVLEKPASAVALNHYMIPTVVDRMFWPGMDTFFEYDGKTMLNSYQDKRLSPCDVVSAEGQVAIDRFMNHLAMTVEDERERAIFLDWLTHVIRKPDTRVNWAVLLQGAQGTGKSYFAAMLQAVIGEMVRVIDANALDGRFTGWAHGATVIVVEEVKISGNSTFRTMDRMKPFITNDVIQIEEKGRDHRTVPNHTSYLLLTNHRDAIPIAEGDRRYMVIYSKIQSEEQLFKELGGVSGAESYFSDLFGDLRDHADALAHFFWNRQMGKEFNAKGRAPATKAREQMMGATISPDRLRLEDAIHKHACPIVGEVLDVTWLNSLCQLEGDEIPQNRTLTAILLDIGYTQVEGRRVKIGKTKSYHYVWKKGATSDDDAIRLVRDFHSGALDDEDFVPF